MSETEFQSLTIARTQDGQFVVIDPAKVNPYGNGLLMAGGLFEALDFIRQRMGEGR